MKQTLEEKLHRKASNKVDKKLTGLSFWRKYKVVIDAMWYECSYRTGFDPSEKNIREREILSDFSNIAAEKIKYLKEQSCEL
jgi:hypothetical protein